MADKLAPVIIKKIKKGGHGHHGGAWKVAYADFVTAMMAFFLLLWLLQATAQSQKEGIAEYFTPTIGVRDSAGIGFKGGKTSYDEGRKVEEKSPPGIMVGRMPQGPTAQKTEKQAPVESQSDAYLFEKGEKTIKKAMEEDPNFRDFKDNVIVEQSPEGLKIEIIDDDKLPMFEPKSAILTQAGEKILRKMSDVIKAMPNRISITGHTEATNYAETGTYTDWELTADRANAARRFLSTTNMEPDRVAKVTGRADQELLDTKNPTSDRNRRVTILLLRNAYLKTLSEDTVAPQELLTVPRPILDNKQDLSKYKKLAPRPDQKKDTSATRYEAKEKVDKTNIAPTQDFKIPASIKSSINGKQAQPRQEDEEDSISQSFKAPVKKSVAPPADDTAPEKAPDASAAPANPAPAGDAGKGSN